MVKPRKLNFGLSVRINKNIMCASLAAPRSHDCELRYQTLGKNGDFCVEID